MARNVFLALALAVTTIGPVSANTPVTFSLNEPVTIAGQPPVTLGPGTYVVRTLQSAAGMRVIQVLSKRQDYVYTTVLTIPATRLEPDDKRQFVFSETLSGTPPALHLWFPPGESTGFEFITPGGLFTHKAGAAANSLQVRANPKLNAAESVQSAAVLQALREVLWWIESGKFASARDSFRRNYFLAHNREGALTSFLLALLMIDANEAIASLDLVNRLDPTRYRVMTDLDVYGAIQSLQTARKDLKGSLVRRFLLNFAMEMSDESIARTAILAFERHVLKGDSLPVELALARRREELARKRSHEERWVLANAQIAKLNDCVKSMLNQVGALEYSASVETRVGLVGQVKFSVVLTRRRLEDLDSIMERSHKTICARHSTLERLIAQRNAVVVRELDSLRSALRELDRQPGSAAKLRYRCIRNWETARASEVLRDLIMLAEAANSPLMRPSIVFSRDRSYVQMNLDGSLAKLAEWASLR
jgi:hypothetical protein